MTNARLSRRQFVRTGLNACAAVQLTGAPAIVKSDAARPAMPQGVASGDVTDGRAVVWSRSDRPARMLVEYSTSDRFVTVLRRTGSAALESTDFTARVVLTDLPPNQRVFYRVTFQDLADLRALSEPRIGSFRTPPTLTARRDVTLSWSADTVGQGWGINPSWGGLRLYDTMQRTEPDLFLHCGDTIYADGVLQPEVKLDDGSIWKNVVTEAKSKVAQTVDDYRGNYKYNLLDDHMRRFNAGVPQISLWDDHEVRDNWYETRDLDTDDRYQVKSMALLSARARQAFLEFNPIAPNADDLQRIYRTIPYGPLLDIFALDLRSYRGGNSDNRQTALTPESSQFGSVQLAAVKAGLASSRAVWKVIATDLPLALVVADGKERFEAFANGDNGPPLGRELEIAELLRFIRDRRVRNVVWVTGDVHYCAAHHYHPTRAKFTEFNPFWEFVAGPLHAGTFGPNTLDTTFGPEAKFNGVPPGLKGNRPPSDGYQFFGTMKIDARTRAMTVGLHNLAGAVIYKVELPAER